ncbi:MAG: shikimate dehydrogenase [Anaerolineaceae bacterium]|nr:shikimate dehydrogenase [Anaerolineaceae bacterium]
MKPQKIWRLGLVGYPLEHSFSPLLHKTALTETGLTGIYRLLPLPQMENLALVLDQVRSGELDGINITIPYKQTVLPYLDGLTPSAQAIGAVNTVYNKDGRLIGENTDAPGFWLDLVRFVPESVMPHQQALVLGAGGAARAVVFALAEQGWQVNVVARRLAQAQDLVETLGFPNVSTSLWDAIQKSSFLNKFKLMVNTTPIGLFPNINESPLTNNVTLPPGLVVYDLVYNPIQTALLTFTKSQGNLALSGLGMLVYQAALAFEAWTGKKPSVQTMESAVKRKLGLEEK